MFAFLPSNSEKVLLFFSSSCFSCESVNNMAAELIAISCAALLQVTLSDQGSSWVPRGFWRTPARWAWLWLCGSLLVSSLPLVRSAMPSWASPFQSLEAITPTSRTSSVAWPGKWLAWIWSERKQLPDIHRQTELGISTKTRFLFAFALRLASFTQCCLEKCLGLAWLQKLHYQFLSPCFQRKRALFSTFLLLCL